MHIRFKNDMYKCHCFSYFNCPLVYLAKYSHHLCYMFLNTSKRKHSKSPSTTLDTLISHWLIISDWVTDSPQWLSSSHWLGLQLVNPCLKSGMKYKWNRVYLQYESSRYKLQWTENKITQRFNIYIYLVRNRTSLKFKTSGFEFRFCTY